MIPVVTPKLVNNTNVHFKFTLISLFSKIHSIKSEHIHSFLFREYFHFMFIILNEEYESRLKVKVCSRYQCKTYSLKDIV